MSIHFLLTFSIAIKSLQTSFSRITFNIMMKIKGISYYVQNYAPILKLSVLVCTKELNIIYYYCVLLKKLVANFKINKFIFNLNPEPFLYSHVNNYRLFYRLRKKN